MCVSVVFRQMIGSLYSVWVREGGGWVQGIGRGGGVGYREGGDWGAV